MALTPRQFQVIDYITRYHAEHGYAPTLREMAEDFQLSRVTIWQHVQALINKEYLDGEPDKARSVKPSQKYIKMMEDRVKLVDLTAQSKAAVSASASGTSSP